MKKVLYIKGGRIIEEASALIKRTGELPVGGPDKFLLSVLFYTRGQILRACSFGPKNTKQNISGIESIEYGARAEASGKSLQKLLLLWSMFKFLWDTLLFRPNVLLCGVDGPFAIAAWLAARLIGAKFVLLAHSALALPSISKSYVAANKFLCKRADKLIAHGPFVKDEVIGLGAQPSNVIEFNNGLDAKHNVLIEQAKTKSTQVSTGVVLYVGRVELDKGVEDLLHAFSKNAHFGQVLRYIGSGSANSHLKELSEKLGLSKQVEVLGPVPFEQVFSHIAQSGVVVTPSQSRFPEGFCKSAMEAFYVGTPVIAPDYGPFPYLIKDKVNGLLYKPDDIDDLALKLRDFLSSPVLQSKLREGARNSGEEIKSPKTPFSEAIRKVLEN